MLGVHPYIVFPGNCREAMDFYKTAVAAEIMFVQTVGESPMANMGPAEKIMHSAIKVGESTIMVSDDLQPNSEAASGGMVSLALSLQGRERAEEVFGQLANGGSVIMPLQKTYWAEAFGMVTDKFGVKWMVNCEAPRQ